MSHDYKSRLTDYLSSDPTKKPESDNNNGISYFEKDDTGVKNVCFVFLDGKHIFLNYNYLVAGEFFPEDNKITLHFTTHVVTLDGHNLEKLYKELLEHLPKIITTSIDRYCHLAQKSSPVVINITIEVQC